MLQISRKFPKRYIFQYIYYSDVFGQLLYSCSEIILILKKFWLVRKQFWNKFQKSNFSIFPEDGQQDGICSFTDKHILENLEVPLVWKISIPHLLQNLKLHTDFLNVSICFDWRENFRLLLGRGSTKVKRMTAIKTLRFILDLMRFFYGYFSSQLYW